MISKGVGVGQVERDCQVPGRRPDLSWGKPQSELGLAPVVAKIDATRDAAGNTGGDPNFNACCSEGCVNDEMFERMKSERGFIAALDQSGGSTPSALRRYGIADDAYSDDYEMFA